MRIDDSNHYHMILEFADGGSLREHLTRHNNLNWGKRYKLALEITNGLRHLHGLNIIHKDLVRIVISPCIWSLNHHKRILMQVAVLLFLF